MKITFRMPRRGLIAVVALGLWTCVAVNPRLFAQDRVPADAAQRTANPDEVTAADAAQGSQVEDLVSDVPYEMKIATPHVPWARPYHLGKTRALVLVQTTVAREVIEFAQRLDLDFQTVTIGGTGWKAPASLQAGWNNATAMKHIWRILADEQLDVIVLRAPWTFFSEEVHSLIMDRVRAGVGLVYVSYDYHPEEQKATALFEFVSQGPYVESFGGEYLQGKSAAPTDAWTPVADHFVCGALPWREIKTTTYVYGQTTGTPLVMWDSKTAVVGKKASAAKAADDSVFELDGILIPLDEPEPPPKPGALVPMVVASEYGKGRVLCVNYNPAWFPGRSNHLIPDLRVGNSYTMPEQAKVSQPVPRFHVGEYCWALLARCTLWAARRDPQIFVADAQASAQGDRGTLTLELRNRGAAGKLACELTLRNPDSHALLRVRPVVDVKAGKSSVNVPFDASSAEGGLNMVEFRLMNGKGVVDFGAAALRVTGVKLSLKVDKLLGYTADPLPEASITLARPLPDGARLILAIEDGNGRLVGETAVPVAGVKATVPLHAVRKLAIPEYIVHARVVQNNKILAHAVFRALYEVPCRYDDWLYGVELYSGFFNSWTKLAYRRMREIGIRAGHTSVNGINSAIEARSAGMACGDISALMSGTGKYGWRGNPRKRRIQLARYDETGDTKWLVREPDSNDPQFRKQNLEKIKAIAPYLRGLGIWDNTIIDEYSATVFSSNPTVDYSFSPYTLSKFRQWVKTQYKSLDEINEAYGRVKKPDNPLAGKLAPKAPVPGEEPAEGEDTAETMVLEEAAPPQKENPAGAWFKSWDDVVPLTLRQAREIDTYAGWVDHRRFMELTSCEYWSWVRDEFRQINPEARISLSGTQAPITYNGHDVWLRCKTLDGVWSYHGGHQAEIMRSFGSRKPGWFDITWTGYAARDLDPYYIWSRMFDGGINGTAYWWFPHILNPDFQVSESADNQLAICKPLREGVGQLLIGRTLETSGIAIHYSQASAHIARARDSESAWTQARKTWVGLIKTTGRQMDFLSYEELENGDLVYPRWKVLILPHSVAMSGKEIGAVRDFVKAGGTVIADTQENGVTDTHARKHPPGTPGLDEMFGIERTAGSKGDPALFRVKSAAPQGWEVQTGECDVQLRESGLKAVRANPMISGAPRAGYFRNSFGKGKAYYFNSRLDYRADEESGRSERIHVQEILENIFNEAGAVRPVSVVVRGSRWLESPRVYCYREGEQMYVGLLSGSADGDAVNCTVTLPGDMFVRELVTGTDYGRCTRFEVKMPCRDARLFSVLPRRTATLEATIPESAKQGDKPVLAVAVKDGSDNPGLRVLRMTVIGPDGKPVWRLEKNVKTPNGKADIPLPFALNDQVGTYKVSLRDVASGVTTGVALKLMPAKRPIRPFALPDYPLPELPVAPDLWSGPTGRHVTWNRSMISKRTRAVAAEPWDFSKGILDNPTLLETQGEGSRLPRKWDLTVRKAGKDVLGEETQKYVTLHEDRKVLFQGQPTTRIEFADGPYGLWTFTQHLGRRASHSVIKVKFAAMRREGREKPYDYDILLRIRAWGKGTLLSSADAKAASAKGKWIEANCTLDVGSISGMDVQIFGKRKETLNISGILFEVTKKKALVVPDMEHLLDEIGGD